MVDLTPEERALVLETREHWVGMRDDPEGSGEEPGTIDCPLCKKYNKNCQCGDCPVMRVTGEQHCAGTPESYAAGQYRDMEKASLGSTWRRKQAVLFGEAAGAVVDWIDENLLAEDDALQCPKCGSTDISLHLYFKDNLAGCRNCRHEWVMNTALSDDQQLPSEVTRAVERVEP